MSADVLGLGLGKEPGLFTKHRRERGGEVDCRIPNRGEYLVRELGWACVPCDA